MRSTLPTTTRRRLAVAAVLLGFCTAAQGASKPGTTYTSSNRRITTMACDDRYLWAGTCREGLIRIDKQNGVTKLYPLAREGSRSLCVGALASEAGGALLVGTAEEGILRFDGETWERVPGLSDNNVRGLLVDGSGGLWAWMQSPGVLRGDSGAWQPVINRFSGSLAADPLGNVWLMNLPPDPSAGCSDGWIHEYVNGGLQATIPLSEVCAEIVSPRYFVVDSKRNCWIGTGTTLLKINPNAVERFPASRDTTRRSITVLTINGDRMLLSTTDYSSRKCDLYVHDLTLDSDPLDSYKVTLDVQYLAASCPDPFLGGFWCAAGDGTIIRIDRSNRHELFITGNSVLPHNTVNALLGDRAGNVWVATAGGIARFDTAWTAYPGPEDRMPGTDVSCLALDTSGNVWAGFRQPMESSMATSGISRFNGRNWEQVLHGHLPVTAIAFDKAGDRWVVMQDGVYRYRDTTAERVFETIASSVREVAMGTMVNAIAFDRNERPVIGTGMDVKRYENGSWNTDSSIIRLLPDPSRGVNVNVLVELFDAEVIGTSAGLFTCAGSICGLFDSAEVLPDPHVQCVAMDTIGTLLIGTKKGLVRISSLTEFMTFTTENSALCDDDITACAIVGNDVWIGTRQGGVTVLHAIGGMAASRGAMITEGRHFRSTRFSCTALPGRRCRFSLHTDKPAAIELSIASLQGKLIRRFTSRSGGTGPVSIIWDGADRFNRPAAAGVYLGVAKVNGTTLRRSVVLR